MGPFIHGSRNACLLDLASFEGLARLISFEAISESRDSVRNQTKTLRHDPSHQKYFIISAASTKATFLACHNILSCENEPGYHAQQSQRSHRLAPRHAQPETLPQGACRPFSKTAESHLIVDHEHRTLHAASSPETDRGSLNSASSPSSGDEILSSDTESSEVSSESELESAFLLSGDTVLSGRGQSDSFGGAFNSSWGRVHVFAGE